MDHLDLLQRCKVELSYIGQLLISYGEAEVGRFHTGKILSGINQATVRKRPNSGRFNKT